MDEDEHSRGEDMTTFPILELPRELRDEIYSAAFCDDKIRIGAQQGRIPHHAAKRLRLFEVGSFDNERATPEDGHGNGQRDLETRRPFNPALLRVNKQIHAEAYAVLYKIPMCFRDARAIVDFIPAIGPEYRKLIESVSIGELATDVLDRRMASAAMVQLAQCTGLKFIKFNCKLSPRRVRTMTLAQILYWEGYHLLVMLATLHGRQATVDMLNLANPNFTDGCEWPQGLNDPEARERLLVEKRELFKQELLKIMVRFNCGRA